MAAAYPERDRTAWILARRPQLARMADPEKPQGVFLEEELLGSGSIEASGVVLLTNKECPWRCLMCDLWKDTTTESVPLGAIPRQIDSALQRWSAKGPLPEQVKLYNSGSFFDAAAIPDEDYEAIAQRVAFARNVVVESHPLLIGEKALRLRDLLSGSLEIAMGLETAHPEILERLNKKFTLERFAKAAAFLRAARIGLRVFILVKPPFMNEAEGVEWAVKSTEFAISCGATAVSLIPTRAGNGAMDALQAAGKFSRPALRSVENAQRQALAVARGACRVFVDTWDLAAFARCPSCLQARRERLEAINFSQRDRPFESCPACGET